MSISGGGGRRLTPPDPLAVTFLIAMWMFWTNKLHDLLAVPWRSHGTIGLFF
jgi:hypothetical protein